MSKRVEQFIPVTGIDLSIAKNPGRCIDNPNRLRLSVYYSTGGVNYMTYKNEARGYYLSATPERIEDHGYGNAICSLLGSGVKDLLLEVNRQSDKQMEIATTIAAERATAMLEWCKQEYGIQCERPAEFFPNAAKRPVPKQKPKVNLKKEEKPAAEINPIRGMKLLTQEIIRKLEKHPFGSQEGKLDDAEVLVKFFGGGACTWLVTEGEQQEDGDWEFFGKVTLGYEWEWGYFRLSELEKMKFPPFGLGVELAKQMAAGRYHIAPPHIIEIPKRDSTEMRKVYCNEPMDRFICAQIGRVYDRMFSGWIHPNCVSYKQGIGVGRVVREISDYISTHPGLRGAKFDIHHYFDDVREDVRDKALQEVDTGSCIDQIVWEYLHDDTVIDENGEIKHVYKGIAQGFAVSPFLANYILRDVDEEISKLNVLYKRYSDDILILGPDFEQAQAILYRKLAEKGLTINPKKVTAIDAATAFTFLGFKIRGAEITFSTDTVKRLKKTIRRYTKTRKGQPLKDEAVLRRVIRQINHDLYVAYLQNDREFGWAEYMFGTVNAVEDIAELDRYIKDHLRHVYTGKWNSCGNYHKVPNEMLRRCGYVSMVHLFKLYKISKPLYRNEVRMKCA